MQSCKYKRLPLADRAGLVTRVDEERQLYKRNRRFVGRVKNINWISCPQSPDNREQTDSPGRSEVFIEERGFTDNKARTAESAVHPKQICEE